MSNPIVHAERSARKWGDTALDYLALQQWFDATKGHLPDNRHRLLLHNSFGMLLAEQVFGPSLENSDSHHGWRATVSRSPYPAPEVIHRQRCSCGRSRSMSESPS